MNMPRRGVHRPLEDEANRLIRESLKGVTRHSDKADILTPWKEADRYRREVFVTSGVPDQATRKGMFHRVANASRPELNCLGGETEVIVRDRGAVPIEELAGTTQEVYTSDGWGKGEFQSYGVGELQRLVVSRSGVEKEIWATPNHRWFVHGKGESVYLSGARKGRPRADLHCPSVIEEVTTDLLIPGQRLVTKVLPCLTGQTTPSAFGVAHGFTFGDGSRVTSKRGVEGGTFVDLFGEKDRCVLPYFPKPRLAYYPRPDVAVETVRIVGLPGFFKDRPDITESVPYLYGWLAGYFAADGDVDKKGYCRLSSHSEANLRFVQDVCYRLGITCSAPTSTIRENALGGGDHEMFCVQINKWSLSESFFVIDAHRERWVEGTTGKPGAVERWVVREVDPVSVEREVYCARVPGAENFLLSDYLLTGNSRDGISRQRPGGMSRFSGLADFVTGHEE